MAPPTKQQTVFQLLTKDFLRFWMVDIRREGCSQKSAPQNRHMAHPAGESALKFLAAWAARAGRHKTQAQPSMRLCGVPRNPNLSGSGLGSARNAGPAPWRAAWSLSSVDGESSHLWTGANPVWPEHCECSPHRPVTFVCSAPPSPQHGWTSEPKKETTSSRCVRVEIRHWKDLQTEAK